METAGPIPDPATEAALRSLKDIALPDAVSWMPHTWGWAMLAGLLALVLIVIGMRRLRTYRSNAYRREAVVLVKTIQEKMRHPGMRRDGLHELAEVLKRVALAGWPRKEVAALSGAAWVRFLDQHGGDKPGQALASLLDEFEYQDDGSLDILPANVGDDLASSARKWIEGHRVSA